eukprot:CAMPEP_0115164300 /NCGR_PEP_ID=MMETSP0227-20121206/72966_1 /TAXON_ID=89957 /ORGANISM="Polarella glacialis, Strain CCMP 1383" /LENGTH=318 /DNA_ID=CAMNT_0002576657 /DNA_START=90 /DNA_END=1046 /DNA_ORIENTATION=+
MAVKDFVLRNFLILGLLTVIFTGLVFPEPGLALHDVKLGPLGLPQLAVVVIFVVSGMCLDSVSDAVQPKALGLSIVLVLFVTPLAGMALFCVVPTTLSSGVTMVTQAKGNVSLAVLLTTVTNLLGVLTMPFSVSQIFSASVPIKPVDMLFELLWLTLVPLVLGMTLRRASSTIKEFAKAQKKTLGLGQNSCILLVVWLMTSGAQQQIVHSSSGDLGSCLVMAGAVHLAFRVVGYLVAEAAQLPGREWVTLVLMCSQKSLPVCVSVLSALPPQLREKSGLMIVPCIMAHAAQLIIDSMLAVRWEQPDVPEPKKAPLLGA